MTKIAVTVIGTNLVMDYGTHEAAQEAMARMQAGAASLDAQTADLLAALAERNIYSRGDLAEPAGLHLDAYLVEYGACGSLGWTYEKWGRVTHKHSCPNRRDPWCQTHPEAHSCAALREGDTP